MNWNLDPVRAKILSVQERLASSETILQAGVPTTTCHPIHSGVDGLVLVNGSSALFGQGFWWDGFDAETIQGPRATVCYRD